MANCELPGKDDLPDDHWRDRADVMAETSQEQAEDDDKWWAWWYEQQQRYWEEEQRRNA